MTAGEALGRLRARRWWVAFVLILIAGYLIGKDMAKRDNARDAVAVGDR